jgi:hypothetical protein
VATRFALLLFVLSSFAAAQESECTCREGNGSYQFLRCPRAVPADPDPCPTVKGIGRGHPNRNPPKEWNDACWLSPRMECFLRRHAASWRISCSLCLKKKCCPFSNWQNCPNCHGPARKFEDGERDLMMAQLDIQRKIGGNRIQMAMSPRFMIITDIPRLKIATAHGAPRIVTQHELLHLYLQRAEQARNEFEKVFGACRSGRSLMVLCYRESTRTAFSAAYFGNPKTNLLYGSGTRTTIGGLWSNGFCIQGRDDDALHFRCRHMIGHLCISTYHSGSPFEKHLPQWIFRGAAHWLSKSHPRAREWSTFCQHEGIGVSGSGKRWDGKAARIAAKGPKRDPVERMFQAATAKQMDYDMHIRAWSWFDVFIKEEPAPFVQFIRGLRDAQEARIVCKNSFGQAPEYVDQRWRERVTGRRKNVVATKREKEKEVDVDEASRRELRSIATEVELPLLASKIRGLDRCQNIRSARLLISLVDSRDSDRVREVIALVLNKTTDEEVLAYLRGDGWKKAGKLGRATLARMFGHVKHQPAKDLMRAALADRFWLVRANAARALAQLGDAESTPAIGKLAGEDPQAKVRIGAMDALAMIGAGANDTVPIFERNLLHRSWQVKSATCDAFKAIGNIHAVDILISRVDREGGRMIHDIHKAIKALTGQDKEHWNGEMWMKWWAKEKRYRKLAGKSQEELEREKPKPKKPTMERYAKKKDRTTYYGIKVFAKAVGYVLDTSLSMEQGFRVSPGLAKKMGRTYNAGSRMGVCKEELAQSIRELDPRTRFNIVFFNDRVKAWKNAPVPATPDMKKKGISAIKNKVPSGQTNYYDALREILQMRGASGGWVSAFADTPDTLFFLTDGTPTDGEITKSDELLPWFNERNRFARLRVHVIAMGNTGVDIDFLQRLAEDNDGTFVHFTGKY